MIPRKQVGRRVEKLRNKLTLSQPEFAQLLGLELPKGRSTVNNWEQGAVQIKSDDLTLISQKTGYSVDWLLGLVDDSNYSNDETIRLISDYTGLSTEAVERLHNLDKGNQAVLSSLIENGMTGALDAVDTALMACDSVTVEASPVSNDLCFDEHGSPFMKLSPENTIKYFVKLAGEIFAGVVGIVVNEKRMKEGKGK